MRAQARRGYVPDDDRWFARESSPVLQKASGNLLYLINEGYDREKAMTFIGNHFLLSDRQRTAILRCAASTKELQTRKGKQCRSQSIEGTHIHIDGFNQIITLETALQKGVLLKGMDGCIRDLAGLRGSYHLIDETRAAIKKILTYLKSLHPAAVTFYLDRQISNSGRLKTAIEEISLHFSIPVDVILSAEVDKELYQKAAVITSDSIILNECTCWFNMLENLIPEKDIWFQIEESEYSRYLR